MDEKRIEENLNRLKELIPVNYQLKESLKKRFKRNRWKKIGVAIIAAAAILLMVFSFGIKNLQDNLITKVNAEELKIINQISFISLGNINAGKIAEYNGTIYIPLYDKGIYKYDNKGFKKIIDKTSGEVGISPDGTKLVFTTRTSDGKNAIYIKDLKTGKETKIIESKDRDTYYSDPGFSPDGNKVIYTEQIIVPRETHGFEVKESNINAIDLKSLKVTKLADGSCGSFVKTEDAIVFERDNKIIYKNLKDGSEKIIDEGKNPSVSPNGYYIAYEKYEPKKEKVEDMNVTVSMNNIWIADAASFTTKKQVTLNVPKRIPPEVLKEKIQNYVTSSLYTYYWPVWSSDSKSIFVLKNLNEDIRGNTMQLMKIELSREELTPEEVVKKFLQAIIVRDEDFARVLMKNPPQMMTMSNPHPVAYEILGSGTEDGKPYVDASLTYGYIMNGYCSVNKSRYYLSPDSNGYIIDSIKDLGTVEFIEKNGTFYKIENNVETKLFDSGEIPKEILPDNLNTHSTTLTYSPKTNTIFFTMQTNDRSQSRIISYDISHRAFKLIDSLENTIIPDIKVDSSGKYLAVLAYNDTSQQSNTYVYNLKTGEREDLRSRFEDTKIEEISPQFWQQDKLIFQISLKEGFLYYVYDPYKGQVLIP
ncbi:Tol biopolymer transport system component [Caldanaerobacter subterraneus subsp. tengcongensis MB4]|uniref:Periplasmic component of the Tol biopolymer transport system n=1 Tax=Caldanaerobacter subterraneus subsp. tengcongensis (strain DSM 15242 / JCM 11007 / NBRC 100824 / MB4) TaxID=273068 RepID=Q8RCT8_CALS4|nr:PD40 domain-containing protein [Caldanaerobacter subterraneus]AAM23614.1 Periplasmic component of the Tol biopolymer transport system [Caldanaerobacter subterraneus subsp. tengcongensis MB4]MCS3916900.1 Tol biopolymer transport system component [Caldanaerobacter subterraneus subsp. tengcongensis MB4]